ncbi:hypothetical protein SBRY_40041 [Actinacidiphila bryophytorum]|uniref:Uncharacterized protein n=1 Tax=Actinacidiphila bryophytorum TaxID=1436133 RepID=A0A9W4MHQ6_9ACTN|nr:hypothetical protein SBRY_40041 [Actinacidiphila bryophytorum]
MRGGRSSSVRRPGTRPCALRSSSCDRTVVIVGSCRAAVLPRAERCGIPLNAVTRHHYAAEPAHAAGVSDRLGLPPADVDLLLAEYERPSPRGELALPRARRRGFRNAGN